MILLSRTEGIIKSERAEIAWLAMLPGFVPKPKFIKFCSRIAEKSHKLHNLYVYNCVKFFIHCPILLYPILGSPISPSLRHVQSCSNDSDTAESAITPLMFVSSELFPLPPSKERGQHLDATQNDCLPLMPSSPHA